MRRVCTGARVPVWVDCWATWCGPCCAAVPEVKRAAHELAGCAVVLEVDTGAFDEPARRSQVSSTRGSACSRRRAAGVAAVVAATPPPDIAARQVRRKRGGTLGYLSE